MFGFISFVNFGSFIWIDMSGVDMFGMDIFGLVLIGGGMKYFRVVNCFLEIFGLEIFGLV